MKQTDDTLRHLFSSKLGESEVDVSPEIWQNISGQLPVASGTAAGISGIVKFAIAAVISGAIALGGYMIVRKDSVEETAVVTEQRAVNQAAEENVRESSASEEINTPDIQTTEEEVSTETRPVASPQNDTNSSVDERFEQSEAHISNNVVEAAEKPNDHMQVTNSSQVDPVDHAQTTKEVLPEISSAFSVVSVDKTLRRYFFMPQYTDASGYLWDFGDGETSTDMSPAHSYSEDGTYTVSLKITEEGASMQSMQQEVSAYQTGLIFIPNIFTPDGDGLNDELDVLEKSSGVQIHRILVYDLNGNKVFESDGSRMWDGNSAGSQPCPAGTYRCIVSGTDRNQDLIEKRMNVFLSR